MWLSVSPGSLMFSLMNPVGAMPKSRGVTPRFCSLNPKLDRASSLRM